MEKAIKTRCSKLKKIIEKGIASDNLELAMQAISAYASYLYKERETYTNEFLETSIKNIAEKFPALPAQSKKRNSKTVLFYDGFGFDTRGLALIYLKALSRLGYRIVYVTNSSARGHQPVIREILKGYPVAQLYFNSKLSCEKRSHFLLKILEQYDPMYAFFYSWSEDVAGILAFQKMQHIERFFINLTDDGFWLGASAFDYCIEFRNYGYEISRNHRYIEERKLVRLPYYPYIDRQKSFEGFPIAVTGKRVVFSGGTLYKTFSKDNLYYKTIGYILQNYPDTVFIYAGYGDDSKLKDLSQKFPSRVVHLDERKDLYQVMKHSYIFINTYPVTGGLMTQYAVAAGLIPLTLDSGNESEGLLLNQSEMDVFYQDYDALIADIDRIFSDDTYYLQKQKLLPQGLIGEDEFMEELEHIMKHHTSKFPCVSVELETGKKRYSELEKIQYFEDAVGKLEHRKLFRYFSKIFIRKFCRSLKRKLRDN